MVAQDHLRLVAKDRQTDLCVLHAAAFVALVKEVVRRGVSYVWDRRKGATTILKKPLSVSRGLYAKFLVIVFSVRRTIARKKGVTPIHEDFFSNRVLALL